jgi:thiol-disulfide isomerase/thioredoxin
MDSIPDTATTPPPPATQKLPWHTSISGIKQLKTIIEENTGLVIISFRAGWCGPCKRVTPLIDNHLANPPAAGGITSYVIDIDECMQIYMELKRMRILSGVPSLICYKAGHLDFFPVDVCFGSDENDIVSFFERCSVLLESLYPNKDDKMQN